MATSTQNRSTEKAIRRHVVARRSPIIDPSLHLVQATREGRGHETHVAFAVGASGATGKGLEEASRPGGRDRTYGRRRPPNRAQQFLTPARRPWTSGAALDRTGRHGRDPHRTRSDREVVVGELACGALANRVQILEQLAELPVAAIAEHEEVLRLVQTRRLHGRGLGWIDAHLLAAAILAGCALWTLDKPLGRVAAELRSAG